MSLIIGVWCLLGSYLVKKLQLGAEGAIKAVCFITALSGVFATIYLMTNCDSSEVLGVTRDFENRYVEMMPIIYEFFSILFSFLQIYL